MGGLRVWEGEKVLEVDVGNSCTTVNVPKATELCTSNGSKGKFYISLMLFYLVLWETIAALFPSTLL